MFGRLVPARQEADAKLAVQATAFGSWGDDAQPTWSGNHVDSGNATQLLTVYGCNRFICEGIATLPVDVLRKTSDRPLPAPAPAWLEEPTPDLDRIAWVTQILTSLLLDGNAYAWKHYDSGTLKWLEPLDPEKCKPERVRGRKNYRIDGELVDGFNVLHIPGVMFPGSDVGMSPVEAARQSIGLGMAAQEFGARFFGQGAVQSGVIEYPNEMPAGEPERIAKAWQRKHSGKSKAHLPAVLQGGAQWKPTAITQEQAQFLETRRFTAAEIAAGMFLIDPTELGIGVEGTSLTYANLEQRNARKVQVTFLPWIVRIERALSSLMLQPRYVKFNVNGLLRGDLKTRYEAYKLGIDAQFLVPNEPRAKEDMPPLDGGDVVVKDVKPTQPPAA